MQTIDIHTHLLNPAVRFDRIFDHIAVRAFARRMGADARALRSDPYRTYTRTLIGNVRASVHVRKICLFPVDARVDGTGRECLRDRTVCAATEDVLALHAQAPDLVIPFLSVNPLRHDALERIDRYVEAGCRGAKLLQNYWGSNLNDRRFVPYFERLAALNIPVVIHLGGEFAIDSVRTCERVTMLRQPLEAGCTVIAAHMALGGVVHPLLWWRNLSPDPAHFDHDYFTLLEMLECHGKLHADLSAMLVPMRARALRHLSGQRQVHHKLLYGSDYPVPFTLLANSYDLPWAQRRRIAGIANPFDAYAQALMSYFPAGSTVYDNWRKVLPGA